MISSVVRRAVGVLCAAGAALAISAVGGAAQAQSVHPNASSVGGSIARSEVLTRLKYWYDKGYHYDQGGAKPGPGDTKTYRLDCSGYADMALHTQNNYTTDTLATSALFTRVLVVSNHPDRTDLNRDTIKTGDVFIDLKGDYENHHAFIFGQWNSNNSTFSYWNFGGGSSGTAPPEYYSSVSRQASQWAFKPADDYAVYRYKNITG